METFNNTHYKISKVSGQNINGVQKVFCSNLSLEARYPDIFMVFLSPYRQMLEEYLKIDHYHLLPHPS
jgi:hypothetical protein